MKKVLVLASVASMIEQFNMPLINLLIQMGYEVDVACNFKTGSSCSTEKIDALIKTLDGMNVTRHQIDFSRSILNLKDNLLAYKQVKKIMVDNNYSFVHCHSPIGGVVARLAGKKTMTRVIYTAHGFHFFKGMPLKNWLIYYPVEWFCAHFTDVLLTINSEDFALAKKKMKAKKVDYVPGVGVDLSKFSKTLTNREEKRKELGIPENATVLFSVGELNDNKNHETVIKAINGMDVYYLIAGQGNKKEELQTLIDSQNMTDKIKLLGFRNDVSELYAMSDAFVFPSFREGLSVSLMEAMASSLPCAVSKIRGNTDLIDANGGALFDPHSIEDCKKAIDMVISEKAHSMGEYNTKKVENFSIQTVIKKMREVYSLM